jgi:TRAP-type C4-dicarboxylate transport system permease large subunit
MYYINPWVFYIIGLITNIQIACLSIAIAGGVIWAVGLLVGPMIIDEMTNTEEKKESYLKTFWKWIKRFPLIFSICVGVIVFTPDEATIYKMMIASKISTSDVEHVMEKIDDIVDSIIDSKEQVDDTDS